MLPFGWVTKSISMLFEQIGSRFWHIGWPTIGMATDIYRTLTGAMQFVQFKISYHKRDYSMICSLGVEMGALMEQSWDQACCYLFSPAEGFLTYIHVLEFFFCPCLWRLGIISTYISPGSGKPSFPLFVKIKTVNNIRWTGSAWARGDCHVLWCTQLFCLLNRIILDWTLCSLHWLGFVAFM